MGSPTGVTPVSLAATTEADSARLTAAFRGLMSAIFKEKSADLRISILAEPAAQSFISAHAAALDSAFQAVPMSDAMRQRLQRSDYIFSGIKTFHELNEAFPSLIDENGNRKPFERFLNDVQAIDKTYNQNYLRAEYNFVASSATMAAKWEEYAEDGDRYNLQYRTAKDSRVRPEHAALHGVTLPMSDPFWESYYPPNGWNCRCTVVQVRKSKYPTTPHDEAMALGEAATQSDKRGIFRFNPGIELKAVPDYNPYTISRCRNCPVAKDTSQLGMPSCHDGHTSLAADIPSSDLCAACQLIRGFKPGETYREIPTAKGKVRIHAQHGKHEAAENCRIATYLADKYGYEIDLLPKRDDKKTADTFNRTLNKKQEYKANETATKSAIDNLIRDGRKQADSIVIRIDSDISFGDLKDAISDRVKRSPNITDITLIRDGKDVTYTREQMASDSFKIQQEDFR